MVGNVEELYHWDLESISIWLKVADKRQKGVTSSFLRW